MKNLQFDRNLVVLVENSLPGPLGIIITGCALEDNSRIRCIANHYNGRYPRRGEFWIVASQYMKQTKHVTHIKFSESFMIEIPDHCYISQLLSNNQHFRRSNLGPLNVQRLISEYGSKDLMNILKGGDFSLLGKTVGYKVSKKLVNAWNEYIQDIRYYTIKNLAFLIKYFYTETGIENYERFGNKFYLY